MTRKYTEQDETYMIETYDVEADQETRDAQVDKIAQKFSKDFASDIQARRSVIAKLSRLKVYKKVVKVSKLTGEKPRQKDDIVRDICEELGMSYDAVESLSKATKPALMALLGVLGATTASGEVLAREVLEELSKPSKAT